MRQDLTGRVFDRLTVEKLDGYKVYKYELPDGRIAVQRRPMWLCSCSCGGSVRVQGASLLNGGARSCGCLRKEAARKTLAANDKHVPHTRDSRVLLTTGDYMRRAREAAGLTQERLSDKAGISRGTLAKIECNNRQGTLNTIISLADVLGLSLDEYVGHQVKGEAVNG